MERSKVPLRNGRLGILSSVNSDIPSVKLPSSLLKSIQSEADNLVSPLQRQLKIINPDDLDDNATKIASIIKERKKSIQSMKTVKAKTISKRDKDVDEHEPEINELERYRILNAMTEMKKHHPHINIPTNVQDVRLVRQIYEGTKEQVQISNKLMIMRLSILGFFVVSAYLGNKFIGSHMKNLIFVETILWPIYDKILLEIEDDPLTFPAIKVNMSPMTKLMVIMFGSTILFALLGSFTNENTIEGIFSMLGKSVSNAQIDTNDVIPNVVSGALNKFGLGEIIGMVMGNNKPKGNEDMKELDSNMSDISEL